MDIHPVHLAREFSRRKGCTFGEFVRSLRITAACDQLRNSRKSIAEIAADTGFADQSHLTRALRNHIGMTPARYRNRP
ncbi:MAG: helix-turn-helix transcriptional regulator [Gemmatimonadales bacterium]